MQATLLISFYHHRKGRVYDDPINIVNSEVTWILGQVSLKNSLKVSRIIIGGV